MGAKNAAKGAKNAAKGAIDRIKNIRRPGKYTEERVPENYTTFKGSHSTGMSVYTGSGGNSIHPKDLIPEPLPASKTSQPVPKSSIAKTAAPLGKSKYADPLDFGAYPDVYDSPGLQEGGSAPTERWGRKRSGYLDSMPLSPMVEREITSPVNTGLVMFLTLIFISFVILKK